MTRINVVSPAELTNQHLMAEYRELPRIFTDTRKRVAKGQNPGDIQRPDEYKLGTGHCLFFTDKLGYLLDRYTALCGELLDRGFNLNLELFNDICDAADTIPICWHGDYIPTDQAIAINRQRIADRLAGR